MPVLCFMLQVKVYAAPTIAVLSTGTEVRETLQYLHHVPVLLHVYQIVSPGAPLGPGQIYDSNRTTLMAAVSEEGFVPIDLGVAQDTYVNCPSCPST